MTKNEFNCDCTVIHKEIVDEVNAKMLKPAEFSDISKFFKTIGDSTRIKIMWALFCHEMCVCDLANLLSMTKSAISHQLRELRLAKLVTSKKIGKSVYYSLSDGHVQHAIENAIDHVRE